MIIRRKLFEKYADYIFQIPLNDKDRVYVEPGQNVKDGDSLYITTKNSIKHSLYLPDELNAKLQNIEQYLTCIDGEYVEKGESLAEKVSSNGLFANKLLAPSAGLVDLSRIQTGFLDILGEEGEYVVESKFMGQIQDVNPVDGITIKADAYALDLMAMSNIQEKQETKNACGEFVFLGDGKELKYKADEEDYQNKVIFVGKYLHPSLLQDLFEKGASFVLTGAMDYESFRNQALPIGIINGFGDIYSSDDLIKKLKTFEGEFVVLDWKESQAFFISDKVLIEDLTRGAFVRNLVGNTVISKASSNYGMMGKIVDVQEGGEYVTVEWSRNDTRTIANLLSLEIVSL